MSNVVYTPDLNGPFSYLSCLTDGQGVPQTSTWITTAAMVALLGYGIKKAIPWVKTQVENRPMLDYCPYGCGAIFNSLFKSGRNTHQFEEAISILNRMNPNFVKDNFDALIANKEHAWGIASGFEQLCLVAPALGTEDNLKKLIESGKDAESIGRGFCELPSIFRTPANLKKLIESGKNAQNIVLSFLNLRSLGFKGQYILDCLMIDSGKNARNISSSFSNLFNLGFGTRPNLDDLMKHAKYSKDIEEAFTSLPAVFRTQSNLGSLMKYAKYSKDIVRDFARLPQSQTSLDYLIIKYGMSRHDLF